MLLSRPLVAALGVLFCAGTANGDDATRGGASVVRSAAVLAQATVTPVDAMSPDMRRAYIVGIQEELATHGYDPGSADGIMGARTVAAIRAYQADAGLPVTGIASAELLDHLKFLRPQVFAGDTATMRASPVFLGLVEEIQIELQKRGYYLDVIDGLEGPRTRAAIAAFQRDAGLPASAGADDDVLRQLLVADPSVRRRAE